MFLKLCLHGQFPVSIKVKTKFNLRVNLRPEKTLPHNRTRRQSHQGVTETEVHTAGRESVSWDQIQALFPPHIYAVTSLQGTLLILKITCKALSPF